MKKYFLILSAAFALFLLPKVSKAATLYISPASGTYSAGNSFTVTVKTNTGGKAVNTAEATVTYSSNVLEVVRASQGSTFYLASPGSPNSQSGSVYFGGGLPNPGYTGSGGNLGSITFRAKAVGTATISISSGSVLLNDGYGTN